MNPIIDYSMPLMKLERMNKQIHELCLANKYLEAADLTQHILVEARMLSASLILMHEKEYKQNSERALQKMADDAQQLGLGYD
jgi:uncharacterized protein YbjQ (UPF0145 family)